MELYILRHGIAADRGSKEYASDSQRPLTPDGVKKLTRIVSAMKSLDLSFDLILSSPYVRARQTAEVVAEGLGLKRVLELSAVLEPGADLETLIADLASRKKNVDRVLLVGHEPMLSSLISLLLSGEEDLEITLKKGGLCKLAIRTISPGRCATLEWLLTPKHLGAIR
jgi:phosphohistidine phosphatase